MARYIETEAQAEERDPDTGEWRFTHRGPFSVLKGGNMVGNTKVMKNVANTSVLQWGGRLFCLWEGGDPYEIEAQTLDTMGTFNVVDGRNMLPEIDDDGERFRADFLDVAAQVLKPILYGMYISMYEYMYVCMYVILISACISICFKVAFVFI